MKSIRLRGALLIVLAAIAFAMLPVSGLQASALKDVDGNSITPGTSTPFSMKQSCAECHTRSIWSQSGGRYERVTEEVVKIHSGATYTVKAPKHGVTAGYHFQQGRNLPWGDDQRNYYNLAPFTSSPGMYGKY